MWRQNSSCTPVTVSQTLWNSISWQNKSFSVLASPFPGAWWGCGDARALQPGPCRVPGGEVGTGLCCGVLWREGLRCWARLFLRSLWTFGGCWGDIQLDGPPGRGAGGWVSSCQCPGRGASGAPDAGHSWSACSLHRHPRVSLVFYFYSKCLLPAQSHPFQLLVPCSQRIQIACSRSPFSGTQTREETHARIWVCINSHSTLATQFPTNLI